MTRWTIADDMRVYYFQLNPTQRKHFETAFLLSRPWWTRPFLRKWLRNIDQIGEDGQ